MSPQWDLQGSMGKAFPGSYGGWKGAQPTPRQIPQRPPGANTHDSSPPCSCDAFSFSDAGPDNGFFAATFDVAVCANDIHLSITNDDDWDTHSGGPFPLVPGIRLEVLPDPIDTAAKTYGFRIENDSATTAQYELFLTSGPGSWSHVAAGQPLPAPGDVFELFVSGLRDVGSPVVVEAKLNGATVLSDSRTPPHSQFYDSMTTVTFASATKEPSAGPATFTDWLTEGTC